MHTLTQSASPVKKNYAFVDAIRGISMIAIVAEHSISFDTGTYAPQDSLSITILSTLIQLVKFGTICFFLLAGFLIGENFSKVTAFEYLKKRIRNTFAPWLFWSIMFLITIVIGNIMAAYKFGNGHLDADYPSQFLEHVKMVYLYTSYWFIPNFLICISILLVFRKHLYSYWLGGVLLIFTLVYTLNIYHEWMEPRHSTAILGFVFFLWLGAQFNKNLDAIENFLSKTPVYLWVILVIISLVFGVKEELYLKSIHSIDQYNSLRFTNIVYSLAFFFLLLRLKNFRIINKLNPRETTYGIYLIHYIIVFSVLPEIFPALRHNINNLTLPEVLGYQLIRFIIVYGVSLYLVRFINVTKFKWSIGR
jgi:surface polysaccharide O-acyltransferase-like enzyme